MMTRNELDLEERKKILLQHEIDILALDDDLNMINRNIRLAMLGVAVSVGFIVLMTLVAWTQSPLIDSDYAEAQKLEQEQSQAVCGEIKNFLLRNRCTRKMSNELKETGIFRGTAEYVQKHYVSLGWEELEQKLEELRKAARQARSLTIASYDPHLGEVTAEDLDGEILHIKAEFSRRSKATMDEIREEYENRTQ